MLINLDLIQISSVFLFLEFRKYKNYNNKISGNFFDAPKFDKNLKWKALKTPNRHKFLFDKQDTSEIRHACYIFNN